MVKNVINFLCLDTIYQSNNYGPFKITGKAYMDKHHMQYYNIEFINTGYQTVAQSSNIKVGAVRDNSLITGYSIGSIHESNNCGKYKILGKAYKDKHGSQYYDIEFIDTKYKTTVKNTHILDGYIKDPYAKNICGVACIGNASERGNERDYKRWIHMIRRCYFEGDSMYYTYGAAGVKVCERWLCFEYYLEDIKKLPGYDEYLKDPNHYQLDKDKLQLAIPKSERIYSPDTCMFIHQSENVCYRSITGIHNHTGYYGVSPYSCTGNYVSYANRKTIGVYSTAEIAAGAYNYFIITRNLNKPLNNIRTLTMEEVAELDLRQNKMEMVRLVKNNNSHKSTFFPYVQAEDTFEQPRPLQITTKNYLSPAQILAPALQHFIK